MNQTVRHKVIILEDNKDQKDYLRSVVSGWGHRPFIFEKETVCLDNVSTLEPDLIITGSLPLQRTCRLIHTLRINNRHFPIVIISADREIIDFVGHNGFTTVSVIEPGLSPAAMQALLNSAVEDSLACDGHFDCPLIVGNTPEMIRVKTLIANLNHFDKTVLIQGEVGTEKELVARVIHSKSHRPTSPFVKLYAPDLLTVAVKHGRSGDVVQTDGSTILIQDGIVPALDSGTLFVEEIGYLPNALQARFLKFFEEDDRKEKSNNLINLRLIVSNSTPLGLLAKQGEFRTDLYYRLNGFSVNIPPLRKRIADIPLLTDFFTDKFCIESGKSHFELSAETKDIFCRYLWPGNLEELKDVIRKIVLYDNEKVIRSKLTAKIKRRLFLGDFEDGSAPIKISEIKKRIEMQNKLSLKEIGRIYMERTEKKVIAKALEHSNWNRKKAAKILDISYKSLLNKIKEYKLV